MKVDINGNPLTNMVDEVVMGPNTTLTYQDKVVSYNHQGTDGDWVCVDWDKYEELVSLHRGLGLILDLGWLKGLEVVPSGEE